MSWMSPEMEAIPSRSSFRNPEEIATAMMMMKDATAVVAIAILPWKLSCFAINFVAFNLWVNVFFRYKVMNKLLIILSKKLKNSKLCVDLHFKQYLFIV